MSFSTDFKKLRQAAGLDQGAAAKLLKVNRQSISNWEREARTPWTKEQGRVLALMRQEVVRRWPDGHITRYRPPVALASDD